MRIVFMGTPDFAVPCLQRILADGHEVPAVFTQPDKPVGRHAVLTPPPVKQLAQERGIPVCQPTKMRDGTVAAQLKELAPDCLVVVAYGRILPQAILDVPPKGCINIHGSLLPKYRGAAPIQWSVINGEEITGVEITDPYAPALERVIVAPPTYRGSVTPSRACPVRASSSRASSQKA